ncbi:MAG: hydantoinase B/oxoprolinase family protein [Betaproteobacteria bacterium]|nr:hydantoinase B/oxoprolinase family protein [Betaproteobacteria bacterium]
MKSLTHRTVDAATVEIIRHALVAAAGEMMINVKRAAYSPSIHQIQDVCVGLHDADGEMLSCAPGLPMFLADLGECVRDGLRLHGRDAFKPGDVYLSNDPFTIGTHINNVATYMPVFVDGALFGFSVVRGHMVDMGGAVPGSRSSKLTEIYQEGLRLRQVKFYDRGEPLDDIHRIIADNSRTPEAVLGDLRAQVAACRTGERRLQGIISKYGLEAVREAVREIMRQGEALARMAVLRIPDGVYSAEAFIDDDGINLGKTVPIRVTVRVEVDEMTIDFSDYAEQVQGSINSGPSAAVAIARMAFKALTTPHEPVNEGHFRPLHVIAPPGKVISAKSPAACGWWGHTTGTTLDAIYRALAPAIPNEVPAAHFGAIPMCLINGYDRQGRRFVYFEPVPGGHGGRPNEDGASTTVGLHEGDTPDVPVEVQEMLFPILVEESSIDPDSGGPGLYRGGLGYRRVFRLLSDTITIQLDVDRHFCEPWGLFGGKPGKPNRAYLQDREGGEWKLVLKEDGLRVGPGARIMLLGGGGGGWGDPLERDPAQVSRDVRAGYISLASAVDDYGVEIDPQTMSVDNRATLGRRARL